jgi:anti-anti-sigma factor
VIEVAGELDLAVEDEFERALRTAIAQRNLVIVDLTLVQFMDCAALGVLIAVRAALEAAAGRLCLVCAGTTVTRLLAAAGVSFPLAESVLEAQLLVDPPA